MQSTVLTWVATRQIGEQAFLRSSPVLKSRTSLKSILYIFVFQGSLETRLHILHKKKKLIQINQWKSLKLGFPLILIPHHYGNPLIYSRVVAFMQRQTILSVQYLLDNQTYKSAQLSFCLASSYQPAINFKLRGQEFKPQTVSLLGHVQLATM